MSATKTTEASLFDCPSHLLPGFVDKRFNADCPMESTPVDHGYRHVSLTSKIAAKGDVFDTGIARHLSHGFTLKTGLRTYHGTEGASSPSCPCGSGSLG